MYLMFDIVVVCEFTSALKMLENDEDLKNMMLSPFVDTIFNKTKTNFSPTARLIQVLYY